jgi:hypothetical protein
MKRLAATLTALLASLFITPSYAADTVPSLVQQPGTQPAEISNLESPDKCDNCHGGYNSAVEPAHNWRGSMMAQAGRDPIFWATLAIAEQDFDGAGDLCLRCHSTGGWLAGRSTPTDGSGLAAGDSDGVECDYCHKLTNPDDTEYLGVMRSPFIANCSSDPDVPNKDCASQIEGFYGSGMSSMWGGSDKLGPYIDADARHQFMQSKFHREAEFCGTCHDVSNPVVGDLAPKHGQLFSAEAVIASGDPTPDSPVNDKAAFNNPPYRYGVVERTFSEFMSGAVSGIEVDQFPTLAAPASDPTDGLPRGGALEVIYQQTSAARGTADYEDGAIRYYTCQTCHMRAVTGTGANKRGVPVRTDLPLHDMTGGNYWMAGAIDYLDQQGKLRLGGGMSPAQVQAMYDGALRARQQLQLAATLDVEQHEVKIINHTGHKLITGYPEGRRMWLRINWYAKDGTPLREDGAYGEISATDPRDGSPITVETIKDLYDPNTRIYEAHMGMTQEWASQLLDLGKDPLLPLSFDRETGTVEKDLGALAGGAPGTVHETFHFVLNNVVTKDNRIPPYGMSYDEAERRNASPVPQNQYDGQPGGTYEHYDEVPLNPPSGAATATIELLYQPTSWEYIQFLYLASEWYATNTEGNAFLADEAANMLDAWLNAWPDTPEMAMAAPFVMASASWRAEDPACSLGLPTLTSASAGDRAVSLAWAAPSEGTPAGYNLYYDQAGKAQLVAPLSCAGGDCLTYTDTGLTNGQTYCYKVTASSAECESAFSNILCATPESPGQTAFASVGGLAAGRWVTEGKGKNAITVFEEPASFAAGDEIIIRMSITDENGDGVSGGTVNLAVTGLESVNLVSTFSDADGTAEATWQTQKPNRKGSGGTAEGCYTATVSGLNAPAHQWDGVGSAVNFTIGACPP